MERRKIGQANYRRKRDRLFMLDLKVFNEYPEREKYWDDKGAAGIRGGGEG